MDEKKLPTKTILMTRKRLIATIILCILAGYQFGFYKGAIEQQQSDEFHIQKFAWQGKAILIHGQLYNVSLIPVWEIDNLTQNANFPKGT